MGGSYLEGSRGSKEGAKGTFGISGDPLPEGVGMSGWVQAGNLQQGRLDYSQTYYDNVQSRQNRIRQVRAVML